MYGKALAGCDAVVLSGSLPPGLPLDTYAGLAARAAGAAVPVVLDAGGPALRHGAAAGPAIAKPNLAELAAAVGRPLSGRAGGAPAPGGGWGAGGPPGGGAARRRRPPPGPPRRGRARGP